MLLLPARYEAGSLSSRRSLQSRARLNRCWTARCAGQLLDALDDVTGAALELVGRAVEVATLRFSTRSAD